MSQRRAYFLEPLDPMMFRDARPFQSGDRAQSGLPSPETVCGMLKSHFLRSAEAAPSDLPAIHRNRAHRLHWVASFHLRGPWLARRDHASEKRQHEAEIFFAPPAHLVLADPKRPDGDVVRLAPLPDELHLPGWTHPPGAEPGQPGANSSVVSGLPLSKFPWPRRLPHLRPLWSTTTASVEPMSGFITLEGMKKVLNNSLKTDKHGVVSFDRERRERVKASELFELESRTGIGIDPDKGTAQKSLIYQADLLRLRDQVGFYIEIEHDEQDGGDEFPGHAMLEDGVVLSFGGEGRKVRVRRIDHPIEWGSRPEGSRLCSVLLTASLAARQGPADEGWIPQSPIGTLVGAAVPACQAVSGWALRGNSPFVPDGHPKPTRFASPAGSVFFWQTGRSNRNGHPEAFTRLSMSPLEKKHGWGQALIGVW